MTEINIEELLKEINNEALAIDNLYNSIDSILKEVKKYREKIIFKDESLDDFKFYNGLIDNTYNYYKKSKTIRLNKFSKDLKNHCIKIKLDRKLDYDIYFSKSKIKEMTYKYHQKVKDKSKNLINDKNKYFWLKDNDYNKLEDWPRKLYYLMRYHKLIAEFLYDALKIENNFLKAKKENPININSNTFNLKMFELYNSKEINDSINTNSLLNICDDILPEGLMTKNQLKEKLEKIKGELSTIKTELKNNQDIIKQHGDELKKKDQEKDKELKEKDDENRKTLQEIKNNKNKELEDKDKEKQDELQKIEDKLQEKKEENTSLKDDLSSIIREYEDKDNITKEQFLEKITQRLNQ